MLKIIHDWYNKVCFFDAGSNGGSRRAPTDICPAGPGEPGNFGLRAEDANKPRHVLRARYTEPRSSWQFDWGVTFSITNPGFHEENTVIGFKFY